MELGTMVARITADTTGLKQGVNQAKSSLNELKSLAFQVGAVFGLTMTAKSFIKEAAEMGGFQRQLKYILGSQEEANRLMEDMATLAGKVPYKVDDITEAAIALSRVMKNGVDDVNKYMPLIADIASVTGMGIEEATSNFMMMWERGSAGARRFRKEGVLEMLGFKAGVEYSITATRRKLDELATGENPMKGIAKEAAESWGGTMVKFENDWRDFQETVMVSGVFGFLKKILQDAEGWFRSFNENGAEKMTTILKENVPSIIIGFGIIGKTIAGMKGIAEAALTGISGAMAGVLKAIQGGVWAYAQMEKINAKVFFDKERSKRADDWLFVAKGIGAAASAVMEYANKEAYASKSTFKNIAALDSYQEKLLTYWNTSVKEAEDAKKAAADYRAYIDKGGKPKGRALGSTDFGIDTDAITRAKQEAEQLEKEMERMRKIVESMPQIYEHMAQNLDISDSRRFTARSENIKREITLYRNLADTVKALIPKEEYNNLMQLLDDVEKRTSVVALKDQARLEALREMNQLTNEFAQCLEDTDPRKLTQAFSDIDMWVTDSKKKLEDMLKLGVITQPEFGSSSQLLDDAAAKKRQEANDDFIRSNGTVVQTLGVAWKEFYKDNMNESKLWYNGWRDVLNSSYKASSDLFFDLMTKKWDGAKSALRDFCGTVLQSFQRLAADLLAQQLWKLIFGVGGAALGGVKDFFGAAPTKSMAGGGTITEPVVGIGRSGNLYQFGEGGKWEDVVPRGSAGSGGIILNMPISVGSEYGNKIAVQIRQECEAAAERVIRRMS
jgi:PAS domain-containing protein